MLMNSLLGRIVLPPIIHGWLQAIHQLHTTTEPFGITHLTHAQHAHAQHAHAHHAQTHHGGATDDGEAAEQRSELGANPHRGEPVATIARAIPFVSRGTFSHGSQPDTAVANEAAATGGM